MHNDHNKQMRQKATERMSKERMDRVRQVRLTEPEWKGQAQEPIRLSPAL